MDGFRDDDGCNPTPSWSDVEGQRSQFRERLGGLAAGFAARRRLGGISRTTETAVVDKPAEEEHDHHHGHAH
jgi:hypothetical protein